MNSDPVSLSQTVESTSVCKMPEAPRTQKYDPEKPLLLGMTDSLAITTRAFAVVFIAIITTFVLVFAFSDPDLLAASVYFGMSFLFLLLAIYILLTPNQRYLVYQDQIFRYTLFNRRHTLCDVSELDRVRFTQYNVLVKRNGKTAMRFPINGRWDNQVFLAYLNDRLSDCLTLQANRAYPITYCLTGIAAIGFGVIWIQINGLLSIWLFLLGALLLPMGICAFYNRVTVEQEGITVRRVFFRTQTLLFSEIDRVSCVSNPLLRGKSYRISWYSDGKRLLTLFHQTEDIVEQLKRFPWKSFEA